MKYLTLVRSLPTGIKFNQFPGQKQHQLLFLIRNKYITQELNRNNGGNTYI